MPSNIFYFLKRWPRRDENGRSERALSLIETMVNMGHRLWVVSGDMAEEDSYRELSEYPIEMVHVVPGKESQSLGKAGVKPDIAIFNCLHSEQTYSALLFNKWNKCQRLLQVSRADALRTWRAKSYPSSQLCPPGLPLYPTQITDIFTTQTQRAMMRSDFLLCPNDFLLYLVRKCCGSQNVGLISLGYPLQEYMLESRELQYRPFDAREHFVYLGNLYDADNVATVEVLLSEIWPQLQRRTGAELHIYGAGFNKALASQKAQLSGKGVRLMGHMEDIALLEKYKVFLDPNRLGGGTRHKVLESWYYHTPVVTTPVGAEGLFHQTLDFSFSAPDSGVFTGFLAERIPTAQEKAAESKIKNYYDANLLSDAVSDFSFGGLCANFTHRQFCDSAVTLYQDQKKWEAAVTTAQKIMVKNQGEDQMEINIKQAFTKVELAMYHNRLNKTYTQEWDKYLKSQEILNKNKKSL